jgi:alpha-methylacyl-CoA racemase
MAGPLAGVRVVELGGIGPGPHGAMLLADLGADVVRVDPPSGIREQAVLDAQELVLRNRRRVVADLKTDIGRQAVLGLTDAADVLVEGFRPGVTERLGVGPDDCRARNPALIYARMTGWGQSGPLAQRAGHDINYLSQTGVLSAIGPQDVPPTVPLNLVGDYGGGSTYLVIGVLAALLERAVSGQGQVLDVAIIDGVCSLSQGLWSLFACGLWEDGRFRNRLDGSAPWYGVYCCADDEYVAVGAIEPRFYAELLAGLNLNADELPDRSQKANWPVLRRKFADVFATRSRAAWGDVFDHVDACVTPVLSFDEARRSPQIMARHSLIDLNGAAQAAPAPRFSRSIISAPTRAPAEPVDAADILAEWSRSEDF